MGDLVFPVVRDCELVAEEKDERLGGGLDLALLDEFAQVAYALLVRVLLRWPQRHLPATR